MAEIIYKEKPRIRFSDLSGSLKAIVIASWIMAGIWAISFVIGMIYGIIYY